MESYMKSPICRLLLAALLLTAAFGASATETQAQFNAQLAASPAFKTLKAQVTSDTAKIATANATLRADKVLIKTAEAKIAADEEIIARMSSFGHSPDAPTALTAAIQRATARVAAATLDGSLPHETFLAALDTGFGPCSDMGEHVGDAPPGPVSGAITYFKQCPINGHQYFYGAISGTGNIASAKHVWFTSTDCTGDRYQIDDGEMYNTMALTSGIVFRAPDDGSLDMVEAGQTANTTITMHSDYTGSCTTEDTMAPAYLMSANDISITGVPESVPANFIY
jgi:hypothetical protein